MMIGDRQREQLDAALAWSPPDDTDYTVIVRRRTLIVRFVRGTRGRLVDVKPAVEPADLAAWLDELHREFARPARRRVDVPEGPPR